MCVNFYDKFLCAKSMRETVRTFLRALKQLFFFKAQKNQTAYFWVKRKQSS